MPKPRALCDDAYDHIETLLAQFPHVTRSHLAKIAGVSTNTVVRMERGAMKDVETIEAILAVRPEHVRLYPPLRLPAGPVVEHLNRLLTLPNVSRNTIRKASGLTAQSIYQILDRPRKTVDRPLYVALMALTPADVLGHRFYVDKARAVQQLRSLQAQAWPLTTLDKLAAMNVSKVVWAERRTIWVSTERAVDELYHRIGDARGPDERQARRMERLGHFPAIYYDDDGELIIEAIPDAAVRRRLRDRKSRKDAA